MVLYGLCFIVVIATRFMFPFCPLSHMFLLVDSVVPGDVVKICGTVKVSDAADNKSQQRDKSMFLLYISANSVENCKESQKTNEGGSVMATEFNLKVSSCELYRVERRPKSSSSLTTFFSFYIGIVRHPRNSGREKFVSVNRWVTISSVHEFHRSH